MLDSPFVYVAYISTTPERLWQGLTDPEFTAQYWLGRRITSEWREGAAVQASRPDGGVEWVGEVLRYEPYTLLSYTFHMQIDEQHRSDAPTRLTFEIEQYVDSVVRLTLTHDHFENAPVTRETTRYGWPALMSSLKSLLETGAPLPFQRFGFAPRHPSESRN